MSPRPGKLLAALSVALAGLGLVAASAAYDWRLPRGAAAPAVPAANPMSEAKVALGRRLFYEADLSADGTMACGACHEQIHAFADGQKTRGGVTNQPGRRNAMTLANVGYYRALTWGDPGLGALEGQALVPIMGEHPVEMGMRGLSSAIPQRLGADACYRKLFAAAFPEDRGRIDTVTVAKALAAFERTLVSMDAPYDRWKHGDHAALSEAQQRGMSLFFGAKLDCGACHAAPLFTEADRSNPVAAFHNIGLYDLDGAGLYPVDDHGLREITGRPEDEGRFRTPNLRNIALTAPYMHDGSVPILAEAIRRHYAGDNPLRDSKLKGRSVSDGEVDDLIAFLGALTDQGFLKDPRFSLPKPVCPI